LAFFALLAVNVCCSVISKLLAGLLEAPLALRDAPVEPRDAIVVLGARLGPGDTLTRPLEERVDAAAMLYAAGAAPRIVTTGGVTGRARRSEADVLADALVAAGVPRDAILVEDAALTTAENARFTAELLGPARVWLVTQPFHARRAVRLFRAAGLDARAWHIADSVQYRDRRSAVRWLVREYAAWAKLLLRRDD
jgi:uncharacterized SAM-binding protein YcdF (DUF218 family)